MQPVIKISSDIVIDAHVLKHTNIQKKALVDYITEILRSINDDLRIAHKEGQHEIKYPLPITFNVPNMNNKECQRIIWSNVFSKLISKNYRVSWYKEKNKIIMTITWMSIEDEHIISQQMSLINSLRSD